MAVQKSKKKLNGWCTEDKERFSQLLPGLFNYKANSTTLDLLESITRNSTSSSSSCGSELIEFDLMELGQAHRLPSGWEKCLDLKTGAVYYLNSQDGSEVRSNIFSSKKISEYRFINGDEGGGKLDLKLNLSASKVLKTRNTNNNHMSINDNVAEEEAVSAMRLVGCHRCLMYFMVSSDDVKCPMCKGGFLLDFVNAGSFSV